MSKVHIYGGGTFSHVRSHLSLCAPAFGATGERLRQLLLLESDLHLTKMVDKSSTLVTNEDVSKHLDDLLLDDYVKCIVMNVALCDYDGIIGNVPSDKYATRLESREGQQTMMLKPSNKVISKIKYVRPDIAVVGFKTTVDEYDDSVIISKAKRMGVDIVLANDISLHKNIIVVGDSATSYNSRDEALMELASHIRERIADNSPIKNIRRFKKFTTYSIEVGKQSIGANGSKVANDILEQKGVIGENSNKVIVTSEWSRNHQNVYNITLKDE